MMMDTFIKNEIMSLDYVIKYIIINVFCLKIKSIFFETFFIIFSMNTPNYSHNILNWILKL